MAYGPVLIWASFIFWLSSQAQLPGIPAPWWDFVAKKTAHMTVFGILYWLIWRALAMTTAAKAHPTRLWVPIFLTILYASTDELHQSFTPGRHPSVSDIGFDSLGMLVAFLRKYGYI